MHSGDTLRGKRPVFVLGSPRSGTTLLYHMLLSAGGFAVYRTESNVFNLLVPRFGDLRVRENRQQLMRVWLGSKLYARSGLDSGQIEAKILRECQSGGDFLRIVMEEITRKQGMERWADCTPEHLLYLDQIKKAFPDALIIHILRDGRDVALSLEKQGWIRPYPWDTQKSLLVAGLYWEWIVNRGRRAGRELCNDYMELHFEDLISEPLPTLAALGQFIEHDLNFDRIRKAGIGSVSDPNTSFQFEANFNPVGRWRTQFPADQLRDFEGLVGGTIKDLGYEVQTREESARRALALKTMRLGYRSFYSMKLWLKAKARLGRLFMSDDLSWL